MNFFKQHVFATEHAAIIQGVLNGDKLTTLCYMEVQRARLRGFNYHLFLAFFGLVYVQFP